MTTDCPSSTEQFQYTKTKDSLLSCCIQPLAGISIAIYWFDATLFSPTTKVNAQGLKVQEKEHLDSIRSMNIPH